MSDARLSRTARMLSDTELGGDLLLLGLAFARYLDHGGLPAGQRMSTQHVAADCWPDMPPNQAAWRVKHLLRDDARRYRPPVRHYRDGRLCGAPMIRRDGTCGQSPKWTRLLTDWNTGEQAWLLACARHVQWYDDTVRANRESEPEQVPRPAANCGGVLARHIPEFGWPKIWAWATDGEWVKPSEVGAPRRGAFELVLGDGAEIAGARPMLGVVRS